MNSKRLLSLLLLFSSALLLASCSGGHHGGCTTNCPSTNATVSITLYDTAPSGMTLLSFTLPIAGISLNPKTGSPIVITPLVNTVEATRLQTDSVLLADGATVAPGTYTLNVTLGPTSGNTNAFINTTGSSITYSLNGTTFTCVNNAVCYLPAGAVVTITPTNTFTLSGGQKVWIGLDLNLSNAITTTNGLSVDFTQSKVLTPTTTTRVGLPAGAVDTLEDFVGVVTALNPTSITVQNGVTGQKLTAALNSSTEYDNTYPSANSYSACGSSTAITCLKIGSTVSVDSTLDSSGTITATEVDVLDAASVDEIEGIIYPTSVSGLFGLIVADKVSQSGNAVLSATSTGWGTGILVNVSSATVFAIDTKTLSSVVTSIPTGFSTTADLLAGQQVRMQVSNVTSTTTNGTTVISATANKLLLRYSRMTGAPSNVGQTSFFFAPPTYITTLDTLLGSALISYTVSTTAYDGVTNTPSLANGSVVSVRALFLNNLTPTLYVAKARVP